MFTGIQEFDFESGPIDGHKKPLPLFHKEHIDKPDALKRAILIAKKNEPLTLLARLSIHQP